MFLPLPPYSSENQPLTRIRDFPVYLTTVLVAVHVAAVLVSALIGFGTWADWFAFYTPAAAFLRPAPVWQWVTYPLVHSIDGWFLLEMVFLFVWGMRLEQAFGRKVFARLYAGLVLITPAISWLAGAAGLAATVLGGTTILHFCPFLAFCFMDPGAPFFVPHPAFQAKYVGTALFTLAVASFLSERQYGLLLAFVGSCAFTYFLLRRNGLPSRFDGFSSALREAIPRPAVGTGGAPPAAPRKSASAASAKYEAKIRPRPELAPEKKAVEEVDALLDKIARGGMASLTPAEREKLQRASERLQKPD